MQFRVCTWLAVTMFPPTVTSEERALMAPALALAALLCMNAVLNLQHVPEWLLISAIMGSDEY
jgi:hypothetical protein